jgi:hypothetical protein
MVPRDNPYARRLIYSQGFRAAQNEARQRMDAARREHALNLEELDDLRREVHGLRNDIQEILRALTGGRLPGEQVH